MTPSEDEEHPLMFNEHYDIDDCFWDPLDSISDNQIQFSDEDFGGIVPQDAEDITWLDVIQRARVEMLARILLDDYGTSLESPRSLKTLSKWCYNKALQYVQLEKPEAPPYPTPETAGKTTLPPLQA